MITSLILYAILAVLFCAGTSLVVLSGMLMRSRDGMDALPCGILALVFFGAAYSISSYLGL